MNLSYLYHRLKASLLHRPLLKFVRVDGAIKYFTLKKITQGKTFIDDVYLDEGGRCHVLRICSDTPTEGEAKYEN